MLKKDVLFILLKWFKYRICEAVGYLAILFDSSISQWKLLRTFTTFISEDNYNQRFKYLNLSASSVPKTWLNTLKNSNIFLYQVLCNIDRIFASYLYSRTLLSTFVPADKIKYTAPFLAVTVSNILKASWGSGPAIALANLKLFPVNCGITRPLNFS